MSGPERWVFSARGKRDFRRLDPPAQRRIVAALDAQVLRVLPRGPAYRD